MPEIAISSAHALAPADRQAIAALLALANARDGIRHPVHPAASPDDSPPGAVRFLLARADGALVGVAQLVGHQDVEVTGLVHPGYRRRGIGRQLLAAAEAELARRGLAAWLLVCDTALPTGPTFAEALGGVRDFAEHRLRLDPARLPPPAPTAALAYRPASPADATAIAAIIAAAFGDPFEEVRGWVSADFDHPDRRWFLATLAGAPVGTLRVRSGEPEGVYVTGFGIAPAYQNQRLGRQFLLAILAQLRAEGHENILIEVETDNAPANALYLGVGFAPIRTFAYYRFGA